MLNDTPTAMILACRLTRAGFNRPVYPADRYAMRNDPTTIPGRVFAGILRLIQLRKSTPELVKWTCGGFYTANKHVFRIPEEESARSYNLFGQLFR